MKNLFRIASVLLILSAVLAGCCGNKCESEVKLLSATDFQKEIDGKMTDLYTLKNDSGMVVQLTNYGARVVALWVPDRNGKMRDVVIGVKSIDDYLAVGDKFYGATVGRYGNRIANGRFTLNGTEYQLDVNDGVNHLHGGKKGVFEVIWDAEQYKTLDGDDAVMFKYHSPDGEMGYPGNVDITVRYVLAADNSLTVSYESTTDAPTVLNLTHHSYFNLDGIETPTKIADHMLRINAWGYTPTDSTLIPTGVIDSVAGTPLDFREFSAIGERADANFLALNIAGGYDHNFVLNRNGGVIVAAEVYSPASGIMMTVATDEPGVQFYGGNFMKGVDISKYGNPIGYREAFCLETQHFPDSPNQSAFPSTVLNPGDTMRTMCAYKFTTVK